MQHERYASWSTLGREPGAIHQQLTDLAGGLEAISWYEQRIALTEDAAAAERLRDQRDEECRHTAIALEWVRRQVPALDEHLRRYLFHPATPNPEAR